LEILERERNKARIPDHLHVSTPHECERSFIGGVFSAHDLLPALLSASTGKGLCFVLQK
jgi:hypothetical protein